MLGYVEVVLVDLEVLVALVVLVPPVVVLAASLVAGEAGAGAAASLLTPPDDFEPLFLKSVTYQPDPLSWNPAAVTCLAYVDCPHDGHWVSGASDIFCSTSCSWPQFEHR